MFTVGGTFICEYIWIGGNNELRSKTRVVRGSQGLQEWNYDASSTGQSSSDGNTEGILRPVAYFADPLRKIKDCECVLVLCETYDVNGVPLQTNHREKAEKIFRQKLEEEPWFGLEQEYFIVQNNTNAYNNTNMYSNSFTHYCGMAENYIERLIVEKHLEACLNAKLNISGINAEVANYQWEFQIGPSVGIEAGDHLIVARYLLEKIAEQYNMSICYKPKPSISSNGSGCHTNFSTKNMREENGIEEIMRCMTKLEEKHKEHLEVYGKDNEQRLTGHHETASYTKFSWGVGTRNTSIRIPNYVLKDRSGYFEDRRPASNMDPYQVTAIIFETCCLSE
jgi:glutamine synthetase